MAATPYRPNQKWIMRTMSGLSAHKPLYFLKQIILAADQIQERLRKGKTGGRKIPDEPVKAMVEEPDNVSYFACKLQVRPPTTDVKSTTAAATIHTVISAHTSNG